MATTRRQQLLEAVQRATAAVAPYQAAADLLGAKDLARGAAFEMELVRARAELAAHDADEQQASDQTAERAAARARELAARQAARAQQRAEQQEDMELERDLRRLTSLGPDALEAIEALDQELGANDPC